MISTGSPLGKHVEQIEDSEDHVQVEGGEEEGEVLHAAVEVAGEGVFYQERGEVEGPQHQL